MNMNLDHEYLVYGTVNPFASGNTQYKFRRNVSSVLIAFTKLVIHYNE